MVVAAGRTEISEAESPETRRPRRRRRAGERLVVLGGALVALALLAPLVLLALDARSAGWAEISRVLFRQRTLVLLRNSVELSAIVAVLSGTIGVTTAWWTERCRLPLRRLWMVLLVLPVAMPDFVVGYAWHSIDPTMDGLLGATLVMTLGTYPLVYLPVAAALRRADPAMEDTARSLGAGRARTFFRVSLPMVRTAALEGACWWSSPSSPSTGRSRSCVSRPSPPRSSPSSSSTRRRRTPCRSPGAARPAGAVGRRDTSPARVDDVLAAAPGIYGPLAVDGGAPHRRHLQPGRPRGGSADRHLVLLDGPEPAHHPAGRRHPRHRHLEHLHLQRLGGRHRRGGRPAGGHDELPPDHRAAGGARADPPT